MFSVCEAELEEVSGHEREQQTRRQLLIPTLEERQSDQPMGFLFVSNKPTGARRGPNSNARKWPSKQRVK